MGAPVAGPDRAIWRWLRPHPLRAAVSGPPSHGRRV